MLHARELPLFVVFLKKDDECDPQNKTKINAAEHEGRYCSFATMSFVETKVQKNQVVDAGTSD